MRSDTGTKKIIIILIWYSIPYLHGTVCHIYDNIIIVLTSLT